MTDKMSKEAAEHVAVDAVKSRKNVQSVSVATVDQNDEDWVVRGTCPIDLEGHPWTEQFEVVVSSKGKVKFMDINLL